MHKTLFAWMMAVAVLACPALATAQQTDSSSSAEATDTTSDNTTDEAADTAGENTTDEAADPDAEIPREPIPDDAELGIMRRSIIIVDDAQAVASERFNDFMSSVDGFFSRAESSDDAISTGSWARIRLDVLGRAGEGYEFDTSLKVKAVLPRTERRLKLLISTEGEESQETSEVRPTPRNSDQNASLALRFVRTAKENGDINLDIGLRQRDGSVQLFTRINSRYSLKLDDNWSGKVNNSYRYFSKSGFENRLSFEFSRRFFDTDHIFFGTYTDAFWEKGVKGALLGHTSGFYWQFGSTRSLALEALASYNTSLVDDATDRFNGYEYRIRWRHNVWRPWFFYEVWPSVSWPSSRQFRTSEGILLRVEVIIGQK